MNYLANLARNKGDPKILKSGRSSLGASDQLARALGWFSIGLGLAQIIAPRRFTRTLGVRGMEPVVCAYGAREIGSGILTLSVDKRMGLWARVAGDVLDIATLAPALHPANPKRANARIAMAMVVGVTALDFLGAKALGARHGRRRGQIRHFADRSGFPKGVDSARSTARRRLNGGRSDHQPHSNPPTGTPGVGA